MVRWAMLIPPADIKTGSPKTLLRYAFYEYDFRFVSQMIFVLNHRYEIIIVATEMSPPMMVDYQMGPNVKPTKTKQL